MPVDDVRIRLATPADAAAIARFGARLFVETFGPDNTPDDIALYVSATYGPGRQRAELADPSCTYLVAESGSGKEGRLAGYALLHEGPAPPSVAGSAPLEIRRFYLDRAFHGAGVSRTLMDTCVAEATRRGADVLWLGVWERNARAIRFYEKCGFRDVGSQPFVLGTDPQTDRVMSRALPR